MLPNTGNTILLQRSPSLTASDCGTIYIPVNIRRKEGKKEGASTQQLMERIKSMWDINRVRLDRSLIGRSGN